MARRMQASRLALIAFVVGAATVALMPAASAQGACKVKNLQSATLSTDLQSAINDATAGDRLRVTGGCVGNFSIDKDLTLRGSRAEQAILDGNEAGRTLLVASGATVRLRHLQITGGSVTDFDFGAGIENYGTLRINRSTIIDNHGAGIAQGGGIENDGTLILHGTTVSGNSADKGGGIHNGVGFTATLNGSTVSGNTAADTGGGVDMAPSSTLNLNDSNVTGNTAGTGGGGVLNCAGTLNQSGTSSVSGNTPDDIAVC